MKKFLNATIKVKHVLIAFVLLVGMAIGFAVNRPHFRPKRHMARMERPMLKNQQMKNHFVGRRDFGRFHNLSDLERQSVDSLRSLMKRGDWDNNKVIIEQIKEIVKGD